MLMCDLHVHSLFSACGLHTFLELIEHGRRIGLKAMAITDHGRAVGGHLTTVFFERFRPPGDDIRLYKGIEHNILDESGTIDVEWPIMPFVDILIFGVHPNLKPGRSRRYYSDMVLAAMDRNPFVDILSHPNDPLYPLDYKIVAKKAKETGMALELNNSKILYKRSTPGDALDLIHACKEAGCFMAVNSDTHALHELGRDDEVRPLLEKAGFPAEFIVNRTLESTEKFIEGRRGLKREAVARHDKRF
ncbi:MAG: PHP domain-containing protein [Chitinispirillaceae bacterium]|nr:PHP domain-containing protein [Chitinispirillaceae bacterium]